MKIKKTDAINAKDIPEGENVRLVKKSIVPWVNIGPKEWRVVYPMRNEDGSFNWFNFLTGGYGNLFKLVFYLFLISLAFYGVSELLTTCKILAADPCSYCYEQTNTISDELAEFIKNITGNFTS